MSAIRDLIERIIRATGAYRKDHPHVWVGAHCRICGKSMSVSDLPSRWYLPLIRIYQGTGYQYGFVDTHYTIRDPSNITAKLIWFNEDDALEWLNHGGAELWLTEVTAQFKVKHLHSQIALVKQAPYDALHNAEYPLNLYWNPKSGELWSKQNVIQLKDRGDIFK